MPCFAPALLVLALASTQHPSWDEEPTDGEATPACARSAAADAASVLFGEAEDLADTATTPIEHAAAGARYGQAARAIPAEERAWKQAAKYVGKAHASYLQAFTDSGAAMDQRKAWLAEDRELLEEYLGIAQRQREAGDPCLADTSEAETNLKLVVALGGQMGTETTDEDSAAGSTEPPPPPPRSKPPGRGLVIGGAVSLAVGGAGIVLMATGMALAGIASAELQDSEPGSRESIFSRGRVGNALAISGGVTAGVGALVGVALLATGITRNQRAAAGRAASLRPAAGFSGSHAMLGVAGAF